MHLLLHGSLGESVPPKSWVLPQFCGYPRRMLKLWAPLEAPQDVLGHELIQKKSLKNYQTEKRSHFSPDNLNCSSSLFCFINTVFPLVVSCFYWFLCG